MQQKSDELVPVQAALMASEEDRHSAGLRHVAPLRAVDPESTGSYLEQPVRADEPPDGQVAQQAPVAPARHKCQQRLTRIGNQHTNRGKQGIALPVGDAVCGSGGKQSPAVLQSRGMPQSRSSIQWPRSWLYIEPVDNVWQ